MERWWIRRLQTLAPGGYNLTGGGDGVIPSEETRQKMSESHSKRVANGTHNFLGENNPMKRLSKEGSHPWSGENHPSRKRVEAGTHHFLGENHPSRKRVEAGTHHFLGKNNPSHKRVEAGTHHFLGDSNPAKRLSKEGRHPKTIKRLKAEWCYIIALSRFWYEIHDYTLKRRAEFLSKDILDTSNAEQEYLF